MLPFGVAPLNTRWISIANFYFLRFVAPALVSPKASGLYQGNPSPQALRALMLISKTLSNAANGVTFGDKVRMASRSAVGWLVPAFSFPALVLIQGWWRRKTT